MVEPTQAILILTNVPDADTATIMGRQLVENRLAACVNCLPQIRSIYRWQGSVEESSEMTLLIKTVSSRYADVQALIMKLHPYEVPEIIAFAIDQGLPAYLKWIAQEIQEDETH